MYSCEVCNYVTGRKDNYTRHYNSRKHANNMALQHTSDVSNNDKSTQLNISLQCFKCAALYKTKKQLAIHEKICTGIDNMTCPRCMQTFTDRGNKSRHVKKNACKPVSIFEYIKRKQGQNNNVSNNISHSTITNSTIETNINSNNTTNNIYINNYGTERMDYITFDDFMNIIKCCNNSIIPKYIKHKHFNPSFPENHNIKYKNNIFFIKRQGTWNIINSNTLSDRLYTDGGNEVYYQSAINDDKLKNSIRDENLYADIQCQINYAEKEAKGEDREIKRQIIDVVKTSNM